MNSTKTNYIFFITIVLYFLLLPFHIFSQETGQDTQEKIQKQGLFYRMSEFIRNSTRAQSSISNIDEYSKEALNDSILYSVLANINTTPEPFVYGEYFIFVYKKLPTEKNDRIAIAFEHELYAKRYPFITIKSNPTISVFVLSRLHEDQHINYRIIINNMWTIDPYNTSVQIDSRGIQISSVFIPKLNPLFLPPIVKLDNETIRFYLYMREGYLSIRDTRRNLVDTYDPNFVNSSIFLVGSISKWDPYLIQMQMVDDVENLFFVDVPAATGVQYYYYNVGASGFLDPNNNNIVRRNTTGMYVNSFTITPHIEKITGYHTFVVSDIR